MAKSIFRMFLSNILLGLGLIITVSPLILYWFIHGDNERYIWIINGPYPLSNFGGGPFQLFMYITLLIMGLVLISFSMLIKRKLTVAATFCMLIALILMSLPISQL